MHSCTFFFTLLILTHVRAGLLRRVKTITVVPIPATSTKAPVTVTVVPIPATDTGYATVDHEAQASAYNAGLILSDSTPDGDNVTARTIRLVGFEGCSDMPGVTDAEAQIYSGWQQAQKIMAMRSIIDKDIDFNTAGALEYLGAAGLNAPRQGDMKQILNTFSSLTPALWPFGYRVHVRCDDPRLWCSCGISDTMFAYTTNWDPESKIQGRINFCPRYFKTPTLNSVIAQAKSLPNAQKYDMARYWNTQGHVWTHEFMHIDWVSGAYNTRARYGHNEHVTDMTIQFRDSQNRQRKVKAYGPEMSKILARWGTNTGDYTIRNADNLALFLNSQYVQSQLGKAYPYLPLIDVNGPDRPPTAPRPSVHDHLFIKNLDGTLTLNETDPAAAAFAEVGAASCTTDEDEPNPKAMTFNSFAKDSDYPSDYISSRDSWIAG